MNERVIRVLCVDDHAFLVEGLKARFALDPSVKFAGRLAKADGLVEEVKRLRPDVVLLDVEMPGADAFEAAEDVKKRCPETKVVFLSAHVRDHYVSEAFRAGAYGYFSKSDEPDAIIEGIKTAARGEFAFGPRVAQRCGPMKRHGRGDMTPPSTRADVLTEREKEVLRMIGRGMARAEIAKTLCRSAKTVDGHRERIMRKLNIHAGAELVRFAIREGLAEA